MSSQSSRLTQIQMRYQQKVLNETVQKKNEMYGGYDDTQKLLTSSLGAGKVRAMFDERRNRNPGIDKSYLLEPIAIESSKSMSNGKRQVIGPAKQSIRGDQKIGNYSKKNLVPPLQNRYINNQDINGNSYYNTAGGNADADSKPKQRTNVSSTSTSVTKVKKPLHALSQSSPPTSTSLKNVTNQNQKNSNQSRTLKSSGNSASSSNSMRSMSGVPMLNGNAVASQLKINSNSAKSQNSQESFDEVDDGPVPEGLAKCSICKRNFAEDRLAKHQTICQKTKSKKRKVYDASKKRVQGTEAESYLRKPLSAARIQKPIGVGVVGISASGGPKNNNNWRVKHEDFINTIRAAKQMQAYVAKGGKLSDLPPPPPSENPDYVQCPHCSRRFNEAAAARHIPICQSINKPKSKTSGLATKSSSFAKRR